MNYSDLCAVMEKDKCCLMNLLPLLIDIDLKDGTINVTPSCFMNEMQLSTEQRLAKLCQPLKKVKVSQVKTFKVNPDIIIFQNFKPGSKYSVPLKLVNTHSISKPLKVCMEPSEYFSFRYVSDDVCTKVAPGMAFQLEVNFSADGSKDFKHEISFFTEGETFDVQLIAIGPRPLLDLPDKIVIPTTAINLQTERTLLVRNLGDISACFVIETTEPFSVTPCRDVLKPNDYLQLTIYFTPKVIGRNQRNLKVCYETGEVLSVIVEGLCEEADVKVSCARIDFQDTFLNLSTYAELEVRNDSCYNVRFTWKKYSTKEQDDEIKNNLKEKYEKVKDYELRRDNRVNYYDVASGDTNKKVYNRILEDETKELEREDCFHYEDENFIISPISGDIWPRSKITITCVFKPKSVENFTKTGYLEINGLKSRKEVLFSGKCKGPDVVLNVDEIDGQSIYICAIHKYEIVFMNIGPIPASVRYKPRPSEFGGLFLCSDQYFEMEAGSKKSVLIQFSSEVRGKFVEQLRFEVLESGKELRFVMIGNVMCPLLNFNIPEVNFGDVAIGYPTTVEIDIVNASQVAIEYTVSVPEDGNDKCIAIDNLIDTANMMEISVRPDPKEFLFAPTYGKVQPYSEQKIKVILTPNKLGQFCGNLSLFMWGSRKNTKSIPVKYISHCPTLSCNVNRLDMKSMFLSQTYHRILWLKNKSKYPGFFTVEVIAESDILDIYVEDRGNLIEPHGLVDLKVMMRADVLGHFSAVLNLKIFGEYESQHFCNINVHTRGPSVDVNMDKMQLGEIQTLTLIQKEIKLTNDSPIPAHITIKTAGEFVTVTPNEIYLQAEEVFFFYILVYATYPGRFKSSLRIEVENGDTDTYTITGTCVGGSILCQPALHPVHSLGTLLTQKRASKQIMFTNKGNKQHNLLLTHNTSVKKFKDNENEDQSIFEIVPPQLDLLPNESAVVSLQAFSTKECEVEETLYMHGKIEGQAALQILFQFRVNAVFQEPAAHFSKNFLEFRKDVGVDSELAVLDDDWSLQNVNDTELLMDLIISHPFYFLVEQEHLKNVSFSIAQMEIKSFDVVFVPPPDREKNKECFVVQGSITVRYRGHPKEEKIQLIGRVNYPEVEFTPNVVDFKCITENSSTYMLVKMNNKSPLPVTYNFTWKEENCIIEDMTKAKSDLQLRVPVNSSIYAQLPRSKVSYQIKEMAKKIAELEKNVSVNQMAEEIESIEYNDKEMRLGLQHLLFPIVANYVKIENRKNTEVYTKLLEKRVHEDIQEIIDIVPTEGHLEPFECQMISINVKPSYQSTVEAVATCHVDGGKETLLTVKVKSGDLSYRLHSKEVDFGVVSFSSICSRKHSLFNSGCVPFYYLLRHKFMGCEFTASESWMNIEPSLGYVNANEDVAFNIDYFPGKLGLFREKLLIDIAYEETIEVILKGCGVLPQIYFNLPRPGICADVRLCYEAISELVYPDHSHCDGYFANEMLVKHLEDEGWVVVQYNVNYPSQMDIDMSIERRLVMKHLLEHQNIISEFFYRPTISIPDFVAPVYCIDFGYVITGTIADIPLTTYSYNPLKSKVIWHKLKAHILAKGFALVFFKNSSPCLIFKPTTNEFKTFDNVVQFSMFASVPGGVKLEFSVKAIVTQPKIMLKYDVVDFGKVKCGNCLKKSVPIQNNGNVDCSWKVSLGSLFKRNLNSFYTFENEGSLKPGEGYLLDVYFEPKHHGKNECTITVTVESNPEEFQLRIKGFGLSPDLQVEKDHIIFPPTLPYSVENVIPCVITNLSPFPVEMCFSDFDEAIDLEGAVISTLLLYYNVKKIYISPRNVGDSLPQSMVAMYDKIMEKLRETLKQKMKQDALMVHLNALGCTEGEYDGNEEGIEEVPSYFTLKNDDLPDPLEHKSFEDVLQLLQGNMNALGTSEEALVTQSQNKLKFGVQEHSVEETLNMSELREGVLLIFHGAPNTDYVLAANSTGKHLNIPVYSVDQLIKEALIGNNCLAALKVNEEIEKLFQSIASETDLAQHPEDDVYDELDKRISLILSGKEKKVAPKEPKQKKSPKSPKKGKSSKGSKKSAKDSKKSKDNKESKKSSKKGSSKGSSKKGSKSSKGSKKKKKDKVTFMGLPQEYFFEIISQKLICFQRGLVIESLTSLFLRQPHLVLMSLLKGIGNVRYIQCIYFSFTYEDYLNRKEVRNTAETQITEDKKDRIEEIKKLDSDEFDQMSPADKLLYREFMLKPRKLKSLKRKEDLRLKIAAKNRKHRISETPKTPKKKGKGRTSSSIKMDSKKIKSKSEGSSKKASKSSKGSSKSSKKDHPAVDLTAEEDEIKDTLLSSEMHFYQIKHIMEYWDRTNGQLLKALPDKMAKTKGPKKGKGAKSKAGSKKTSKKGSKKASSKGSKKDSKKVSKPGSKKGSKKGSSKDSKDGKKVNSQVSLHQVEPEPPKIAVKILTPEEALIREQTGIPLWVLNNVCHGEDAFHNALLSQLIYWDDLVDSLTLLDNFLKPALQERDEMYTVLRAPRLPVGRFKNKSTFFALFDGIRAAEEVHVIPLERKRTLSVSMISENASLRSARRSKDMSRRFEKAESVKSATFKTKVKEASEFVVGEPVVAFTRTFTPRVIIQPNECWSYDIYFNPNACGHYIESYNIEIISSWKLFTLNLEGRADIPKMLLNPEKIFSNIAIRHNASNDSRPTYFKNENNYSFGPVYTQEKDNAVECLYGVLQCNVVNDSLLALELWISCMEPNDVFSTNVTEMTVSPGSSQVLMVYSHPHSCENYENKLIMTIKNNPKVETLKLSCTGAKYQLEIVPREIAFERMSCGVPMTKDLILRNTGVLGMTWEFADFQDTLATFKTTTKTGTIKPLAEQIVTFRFKSDELIFVPKKELQINIYDKRMKCTEPFLQEVINISAEVVDLILEYVPDIDFGNLKLDLEVVEHYTITNKSRHELTFRFDLLEDKAGSLDLTELKSCFKLEHKEGILKVNQTFNTKIKFLPKYPHEFHNLSVYECHIFDAIDGREVHSFELKFSATIHNSRFKICPPSAINFGHQLIQTEVAKEIILKNMGMYSFSYTILSMRKLKQLSAKVKGKGKKGKGKGKGKKGDKKKGKEKKSKSKSTPSKSKSSKSKKSSGKKSKGSSKSSKEIKVKPTTLNEGIFSLISSTGTVEPESEAVIRIASKPNKLGEFEEEVVFMVSESIGKEKNGRVFNIQTKGCLPNIDFTNYEEIFKEIYVVESLNDMLCEKQLEMVPVFVKEETQLNFNKNCLNIPVSARLKISNCGFIGAEISCGITEGDAFTVNPNLVYIDAYKYEYITVYFTPKTIEKVNGILQITVLINSSIKFTVKLSGEGYLPEITMLAPEISQHQESYSIIFNPVMVGSKTCSNIVFKNTGVITCKVLIGVQGDAKGMFSLVMEEYPKLLQKLCSVEDLLSQFSHTIITELQPEDICKVGLQFKPTTEERVNSVIKLHVINNPFEMVTIYVNGEGYREDIILEGLDTMTSPKSLKEASVGSLSYEMSKTDNFKSLHYNLNYGYRFINKLHKFYFKIKNISTVDVYRFRFTCVDKLLFIPTVGHLKPLAYKEVIVTFFSKEAVVYDQILLECKLLKIKYVNPEYEPTSWDDRQHFTIWEPVVNKEDLEVVHDSDANHTADRNSPSSSSNLIKTIKERSEPVYEEIEGTERSVNIYLSVILDYCSYECDNSEVSIEDTLMFEKRSATFCISNKSRLPINLNWNLAISDEYPRISEDSKVELKVEESRSITKRPVSIRPQSCTTKRMQPQHLSGEEKFIESTPRPRTSHYSTISCFTDTTSGTSNSDYLYERIDIHPFSIVPIISEIPPNEDQTFTVTFSPYDVGQFAVCATSNIPNLKPELKPPSILIRAKSLLPLYHFNIEPSEYITKRREGREICGQVCDESTKVVEFDCLGVGVPTTRKFTIINPTGEDFDYRWEKGTKGNLSMFQCHTPEGSVTRGKMTEAMFTFVPQKRGVFESFYVFFIEKYNLRTNFLLVGNAREPCVFFNHQSLIMKPTIIGIDIHHDVVLKNNEKVSLKFNFKKTSLYSDGRVQRISVEPMVGFVGGNSEQVIRFTFHPKKVGLVTYNVECEIDRMQKPLFCAITANCFEVQPIFKHMNDTISTDLQYGQQTSIELSSLIKLKEDDVRFKIENVGKIGFYYKWAIKDKYVEEYAKITFHDKEGYIKTGTVVESVVTIKPVKHLVRKVIKLFMEIPYGPVYTINLVCTTSRAKFKLSFNEYNFGPCLVQMQQSNNYGTVLEIANFDLAPILVEVSDNQMEHLTVINQMDTVQPKQSGKVLLYFHPKELRKYFSEIVVYLNGIPQKIKVMGEGVPLEIELVDPIDKFINLGPVHIGKHRKKRVRVVNRSKCAVKIIFELSHRLPYFSVPKLPLDAEFERVEVKPSDVVKPVKKDKKEKKKGKKGSDKKSKKSSDKKSKSTKSKSTKNSKGSKGTKKGKDKKSSKDSKGSKKGKKDKKKKEKPAKVIEVPKETPEEKEKRLINDFVKVNPSRWIKLCPEQTTEFVLTYLPVERMPLFSEQIFYQVLEEYSPICMFKSSCIASEYYLDNERLSFGTVIKGCSNESFVNLYNTGDIGGKFKWNFSKKCVFSIEPSEGYITPNMSIAFSVKYLPNQTHCLYKTMAKCIIENYEKPLNLELLGTCVNLPPPKDTLKFLCPVREIQQKEVTISNQSGNPWYIAPSLNGQYFHVQDEVIVPPKSVITIPIRYMPLAMTLVNKIHEGKLFLALPEGQGIVYNLIGEAQRPKTTLKIERTISSKTYHTETITLTNWLPIPQRFTVVNQIDQPENASKVLYKLTGNEIIDTPPMGEREYKWTIYALTEGKLNFKVKFRNESTKEYIQYEVLLTIIKCSSLEVIRLHTCARQSVQHKLQLENPINKPAIFTITSTSPDLHFLKTVNLEPYTKIDLAVVYKPLFPSPEFTATLEAKTTTLGTFPYTFILNASSAQPEESLHIDAQLGQVGRKITYLHNFAGARAEFTAKINDGRFSVGAPESIPPKGKGSIEVFFEPDSLGACQSKLFLTSPVLGEYVYPLVGNCVLPKPQGPFSVKEGSYTSIPFKNPYQSAKTFNFSVEPYYFLLKAYSESVKPKGAIKIQVGLNTSIADKEYPVTGKLYVTCEDADFQTMKWVIYLKAETK